MMVIVVVVVVVVVVSSQRKVTVTSVYQKRRNSDVDIGTDEDVKVTAKRREGRRVELGAVKMAAIDDRDRRRSIPLEVRDRHRRERGGSGDAGGRVHRYRRVKR